jgi:hypothetical protein
VIGRERIQAYIEDNILIEFTESGSERRQLDITLSRLPAAGYCAYKAIIFGFLTSMEFPDHLNFSRRPYHGAIGEKSIATYVNALNTISL